MIDYKELYKYYNGKSNNIVNYRFHKVMITKNMNVLLDILLRSCKFDKNGDLYLDVLCTDKKILSMFNKYDIIDCYNHLDLDKLMYGECISKDAKEYVNDKMKRIKNAKRKI